jgi:small subunit ribosomal protein S10
MGQKIRIRVEGYDHDIIDQYVREIIEAVKRTGAKINGPMFLPTHIERITVLRSSNIDKNSREQFEIRTHKRLIDIVEPTARTTDELKNLTAPAGVDIKMKLITEEK